MSSEPRRCRLSSATSSQSRVAVGQRDARLAPTKPAPPVIRTRIGLRGARSSTPPQASLGGDGALREHRARPRRDRRHGRRALARVLRRGARVRAGPRGLGQAGGDGGRGHRRRDLRPPRAPVHDSGRRRAAGGADPPHRLPRRPRGAGAGARRARRAGPRRASSPTTGSATRSTSPTPTAIGSSSRPTRSDAAWTGPAATLARPSPSGCASCSRSYEPPDFAHVPDPDAALFLCAMDHRTGYAARPPRRRARGRSRAASCCGPPGCARRATRPGLLTAAALAAVTRRRRRQRLPRSTTRPSPTPSAAPRCGATSPPGSPRDHGGSAARLLAAGGRPARRRGRPARPARAPTRPTPTRWPRSRSCSRRSALGAAGSRSPTRRAGRSRPTTC